MTYAPEEVLRAARWAMARGRLRHAEEGYRWLLGLRPWPQSLAGVAREEVALALAEVLLDRADGRGLVAVLDDWAPRGAGCPWRWRAIEAQRMTDIGLLSDARAHWGELAEAAHAAGDPWATALARAQRDAVLLQLNRLDEARGGARLLAFDGVGALGEEAVWNAWADARASGAEPTRTRSPAGVARWSPPPPTARARAWLARLSNRVVLALDAGAVDEAARLLDAIEGGVETHGEPALGARVAWVTGLVAWAAGDLGGVLDRLGGACEDFLRCDLRLDAWNAARAATVVAASHGLDPSAWRRTERDVRERLAGELTSADRVFFLATRGAAVNQDIADAVARANDPRHALDALRLVQGFRWGSARDDASGEAGRDSPGPATAPTTRVWQWLALRRGFAEEPFDLAWLPPDVAVLDQVVLDTHTATFVVTQRGCRVVRASTGRRELSTRVEAALGEVLAARRITGLMGAGSALTDLAAAYALPEIVKALGATTRRVLIRPDGPGVQVPWAALPVEGAPWVARVEIGCVSTLRRSTAGGRVPTDRSICGVAVERSEYGTLPLASGDLRGVAEAGWRLAPPSGASSRAGVLAALSGAGGAHFACHGVWNGDDPMRSGLWLEDARLDLAALCRLDLRGLELAVLAACWASEATQVPGRELVGIPFALHAARVGAVVAPTWPIPDHAGEGFARRFWGHVRARDAVGALAATQREVLGSLSPRSWAGWRVWVDGVGG